MRWLSVFSERSPLSLRRGSPLAIWQPDRVFWSVPTKQVKPVTVAVQQMMVTSLIGQATTNHDQACEPPRRNKSTPRM